MVRRTKRTLSEGKPRVKRFLCGAAIWMPCDDARMRAVNAYSSDRFVLPLPSGHRFPMQKYRLLRERVQASLPQVRLLEPPPASDAQLLLAHDPDYIDRFCSGALSESEQRAIGFPWSPEMVERSRRSAGATLAACRDALFDGVAVNLAGGTHHAYADRGEGFCCFNDAALATRVLQREFATGRLPEIRLRRTAKERERAMRVAIIDLDVHQGNGTAAILGKDPDVFTLSIHGERNYPFKRDPSTLDIDLPDGTTDADYLAAVHRGLDAIDRQMHPDLAIYLAGADPYEGDRLGRLSVTTQGLQDRDRTVLSWANQRRIPVAIAMAGGYAVPIEATVAIQFETVHCALLAWRAWGEQTAVLEPSA